MALDIDTSRPLRRHSELLALIEAIYTASNEDETDWLEWKSELPLKEKEAHFSISRTVLALANRAPAAAARACGGLGYIVIGAEASAVAGIQPLDPADLEDALRPYVGGDGPLWAPVYVRRGDTQVLVIIVEAPQPGDAIHPLRKTYQSSDKGKGADEGTIFVRRSGKSVRASATEIDQLTSRIRAATSNPTLTLNVGVSSPEPFEWLHVSDDDVSAWVAREITRLDPPQATLQTVISPWEATLQNAIASMNRERRSREGFETQVSSYVEECRSEMAEQCASAWVAAGRNRFEVVIENPTEMNYSSVLVSLHAAGPIEVYERPSMSWPTQPFPWGEDTSWGSLALGPNLLNLYPSPIHMSSVDIENGGSATMHVRVGDLRPHATYRSEVLFAVVDSDVEAINFTWTATSTRIDGRLEGAFDVPVLGPGVRLTQVDPGSFPPRDTPSNAM